MLLAATRAIRGPGRRTRLRALSAVCQTRKVGGLLRGSGVGSSQPRDPGGMARPSTPGRWPRKRGVSDPYPVSLGAGRFGETVGPRDGHQSRWRSD